MKKQLLILSLLSCVFSFGQWSQLGLDIDGEAKYDQSGYSISLSADGSTVAIGAFNNDGVNGPTSLSGHVRVYKNEGGTWSKIGADIDGETAGDKSGFSVSLSADGSTVAIGAFLNDGINGSLSGHVRVYKNEGGTWSKIGADIDGEAAADYSGWSVSLSADGSTVAVGAVLSDGINGSDSGHVGVYKNEGGVWSKIGDNIDGEASGNRSGVSVSLSSDGSTVVIGAIYNDGINGNASGHVRVYKNEEGTWSKIGDDIDGEAAEDYSGHSVSLSADGSTVAIGAFSNDGINGNASGHVRVYKNEGGKWSKIGADIDGEAAADESGHSVSLSADGSIVAIGADENDGINGSSSDSGHVRVYKNEGGTWSQLGLDIDGEAAYDESGTSVSLSADGSIVAIGAPYNDGINGSSSDSGHVRVYKYTDPTTLSASSNTIEGLTYKVFNGRLITNQKETSIYITDVLGKALPNHNLQGVYVVKFVSKEGEIQTNKLLIE